MGWVTVEEESPVTIVFDTPGESFTGTFMGKEVIPVDQEDPDGETFTQIRFRNDNGFFAINAGYKLLRAFDKVKTGSLTRVTYVKDLDTSGGKLNPMKDFRVEVAE
jgi:hypothetical protein